MSPREAGSRERRIECFRVVVLLALPLLFLAYQVFGVYLERTRLGIPELSPSSAAYFAIVAMVCISLPYALVAAVIWHGKRNWLWIAYPLFLLFYTYLGFDDLRFSILSLALTTEETRSTLFAEILLNLFVDLEILPVALVVLVGVLSGLRNVSGYRAAQAILLGVQHLITLAWMVFFILAHRSTTAVVVLSIPVLIGAIALLRADARLLKRNSGLGAN